MNTKRCSFSLIIYVFVLNLRLCFGQMCIRYIKIEDLNCTKRQDNSKEINDYIHSLSYDRDTILAFKGDSVTRKLPKKEAKLNSYKNFIVITREKKSIMNGKADIGVILSNQHVTYPGALLSANSHFIKDMPDVWSIKRSPIRYTINLPRLTTDGSFIIVPSYGNYKEALNTVLNKWFDKYPHQSVPAIFQSDYTLAYSKDQLRAELGVDFEYSGVEAFIDFDAISREEKMVGIYRFKQIFYTVSVETPENPSDFFDSSVTCQQIAGVTNNTNPPVLVDSVSYGRLIYSKIETTSTDFKTKNIFKANIFTYNIASGRIEYNHELEDVEIRLFVLGGGSEQIELLEAKNIEDILDIITKYGEFNANNLGYPIYYTNQFIKDNSRALVIGSAEYIDTTVTVFRKGVIKLSHHGWYVAKWTVDWDEIGYDSHGEKYTKRKSWYRNNDDLTAPFEEEIELKGNVENIKVTAKEQTGLFWEGWRTIFSHSGISLINYRTFSISGTTLSPSYSIKPSLD